MANLDLPSLLVAAALGVILVWAAYSDYRNRRIPNLAVLIALVLFGPWTYFHHFQGLVPALLTGAGMLVATFVLYNLKIFGAGDAKLISVLALFTGLDHLMAFLVTTALAGGVLAVVGLLLNPRRALSARSGGGIASRGVPYGVAIAIGGAVTIGAGVTHILSPWF